MNANDIIKGNPIIMGILNITPDSFYESSRSLEFDAFNKNFNKVINADIIDIGAESTRPSSKPLTEDEELKRLDIVFDNIDLFNNKILSIDTYRPVVAKKALMNGFSIINDIFGGKDEEMLLLASELNAKIVLMHIKGNPKTMQEDVFYEDIIDDIMSYFDSRINRAIKLGVKKNNIIIDPGIGFGKSLSDNYKIINNINKFKQIGFDVMVGLSRKSFLSIDNDNPSDRLVATVVGNAIALLNGADIIRVHDVEEHIILGNILNRFNLRI